METSEIVKKQRDLYNSNITKNIDYRIKALKRLRKVILANEDKINDALKKDLNKSPFETYMCEIGIALSEITYTLKNIRKWTRIKKVKTPISLHPAKSFIVPESYGVTLIIAPWNYPFLLSIQPLISAIAAGNTAVIKPSEYSKNTSKVVADIIKQAFEPEYVTAAKTDMKTCEELLNEKFDYIFFTGSTKVAKIIMEKASKTLTPVTLELGGKSPCIVDETADIEIAAKRIVFGKILNAGQTCVAPDYILVNSKVKTKLIENMKKYIEIFLGENAMDNVDYPNIISKRNFNRLEKLLQNENIVYGGNLDKENLKIDPTILDNVKLDSPVMNEEIFGPILPVISFDYVLEAIEIIKKYEKSLALYLFTNDKAVENKVLNELSFGGGCINDTMIHLSSSYLGFGGVGNSGIGSYHGKNGFDTFTHYKGVLKKSKFLDIPLRYRKYTDKKLKFVKMFLK